MTQAQLQTRRVEHIQKPPRSLWRNRDYMLLWSGQIVSSTGTRVSSLALPLLVLAVTGSPAQAGIMAALRAIPYVFLALPAGALVDRWDRKQVMIVSDVVRALAFASIPLAILFNSLTFAQLAIVSLLEGTMFTFFNMAETACLTEVVEKEQLTEAAAQGTIIDSVSGLVGPSLGGLLYSAGQSIPFLADAVSYVVSFVSLLFVYRKYRQERQVEPVRIWTDIKEGLLWLWREPVMRFIALLTCGLYTPVAGWSLIIIVLAQGQHASSFVIGLIFAAGGIGSILGAFLVAPLRRRFTFRHLMVGGTWAWAITWLPFALAPNPVLLGIAVALAFIVVPVYMSVQLGYRLEAIPNHLQGRVNSVFRLVAFGSEPIGLAITGFLLQVIGPIPTVLALFVPQLLLSILATFNRSLRKADTMS